MSITGGSGSGSNIRRSIAARRRSSFRSTSTGGNVNPAKDTRMMISKEDFVENYPQLLLEVTMDHESIMGDYEKDKDDDSVFFGASWQYPGIDITFENLSLNIHIGKETLSVVDNVTGRIKAQTMTALMGGSGAGKLKSPHFFRKVAYPNPIFCLPPLFVLFNCLGKTSLLNALCGRAFYGDVTGQIYLNGHRSDSGFAENFKDAIGFVPQDDIVYPELTVRENLLYAGRFRLPKGTDKGMFIGKRSQC